jgi:ribulose 1,5-bisphosphate synthetase/thiazole synthase
MAEKILKSKLVNFLVADVEVNYANVSDVYAVAESGDVDVLAGVLEAFKEAYGGLWVGGKLEVTPTVVRLNANAMNRLVQDGTLDIELPLAWVRKVSVEGGFMTKIVRLDIDAGSVKFRCFGAKDVASLIEKMTLQ